MEYDIKTLPIDDIATLLNFYYECQKSRAEPMRVRDIVQAAGKRNYYLDGKQYTFYSEDAARIIELIMDIDKPHGKLEMIKDKITHGKEHEKETLDFVIRELNKKLNEFFNERSNLDW